jgi:transposase-like protein
LAQVYDVLDRFPRLQAWLSAAQKQGLGGHDRRAPEVTPEEQELEAPLVAQLEREADEAEMMAEALTGTIRKG